MDKGDEGELMSKKRPSDAQLAEMLTTPHFGQRRPETPPRTR